MVVADGGLLGSHEDLVGVAQIWLVSLFSHQTVSAILVYFAQADKI